MRETVLKNFAIFIGKHLCWSLFLKVTSATRLFFDMIYPLMYNERIFLFEGKIMFSSQDI